MREWDHVAAECILHLLEYHFRSSISCSRSTHGRDGGVVITGTIGPPSPQDKWRQLQDSSHQFESDTGMFVSSLLLIYSSEQPETASASLMSLISCLSAKFANLNVADWFRRSSALLTAHRSATKAPRWDWHPRESGLRQPWTLEGVGHHPMFGCEDIDCSRGQRVRLLRTPEFRPSCKKKTAGSPVCAKTPQKRTKAPGRDKL